MKYSLIGCGRVSPNHIKAAKENKLEICAVCDTVPEHIDTMFKNASFSDDEIKAVRRYSSWCEMLDTEKPDLVSIALPSGLHFDAARDAITRGINCIIEKPMAMSTANAKEIIRLTEKHGVTVSVCHQNRFNTAVRSMRSSLENGRFGRLSNAAITVRWHRTADYYKSDDWRGKWATDGGTLMNQCIHGIDLLRWMCADEIDTVCAFTNNALHPMIEAEDVGVAVIKFSNGCLATVEGTVNNAVDDFEEHLTLIGEHGTMKLGGICANTVEYENFDGIITGGLKENVPNVYGNGHISLFADVKDAIENHRPPYVDVYAGYRAVETILAIYKSAHDKMPVSLPLGDVSAEEFADTQWKTINN